MKILMLLHLKLLRNKHGGVNSFHKGQKIETNHFYSSKSYEGEILTDSK